MTHIDTKFLSQCFGLDGRTAVVTGAGSGLGRQAAKALAAAGAEVALLGRREPPLKETEELIRSQGGRACSFSVDVTDRDALGQTLDAIQRDMPPLWVLVNNAGVGGRAPLLDVSAEQIDQILGVNTKAALLAAAAFAQRLVAGQLQGRIVNVCSLAAQTHPVGLAVYGASKAALEHLTRSMAREWMPHGINVNAINPGYIETDINHAMFRSPAGQQIVKGLPRQRLGTPEVLDGALLLLSSPASTFITGSTITVDDGQRFSAN